MYGYSGESCANNQGDSKGSGGRAREEDSANVHGYRYTHYEQV